VKAERRIRLDRLLAERGMFPSRERAQAAILAGHVAVDGRRVDKAGMLVTPDSAVEVLAPLHPYASRGGVKLAHALDTFGIDPAGWVVADVGASTGGFTDCWLQRGAHHVFCIDVGRGQLIPRLAGDPRVTVRDRLNARYLALEHVGGTPVDAASVDVSFIGLALVLPAVAGILRDGGTLVALVKPQFEVGPRHVGKGGIVRDPTWHRAVLERLIEMGPTLGLGPTGVTASPIRGQHGNREFLLHYVKGAAPVTLPVADVVKADGPGEGGTS
jgi:23S rRNA (cytidine1920-2'-O)/16S rRNA (cytidine1409-2'-O)-methyltransferase